MRLLLDENIPDEIEDRLNESGFDVRRVAVSAKDSAIALLARNEERILITQDKDFTNPLMFPPKNFHGIVRIKIHPPVISDIWNALENLFKKLSDDELKGKLVILERDGLRIR